MAAMADSAASKTSASRAVSRSCRLLRSCRKGGDLEQESSLQPAVDVTQLSDLLAEGVAPGVVDPLAQQEQRLEEPGGAGRRQFEDLIGPADPQGKAVP